MVTFDDVDSTLKKGHATEGAHPGNSQRITAISFRSEITSSTTSVLGNLRTPFIFSPRTLAFAEPIYVTTLGGIAAALKYSIASSTCRYPRLSMNS